MVVRTKPTSFLIPTLVAALLVLVAPLSAQATKIIPMSPEKLGQTATVVVRGTVTSVESFWNASGSKIFTETIIAVDESYKGAPGDEVRLLQLGGEVDGVRVTVHGALHWDRGEEVVAFLEPNQGGRFAVTGFSQGKFKVERDPTTGRAFIHRPAQPGVELVSGDGHSHGNDRSYAREPLDGFLARALGRQYAPSNR